MFLVAFNIVPIILEPNLNSGLEIRKPLCAQIAWRDNHAMSREYGGNIFEKGLRCVTIINIAVDVLSQCDVVWFGLDQRMP